MRTSLDDVGSIYFANAPDTGLTKIGFALNVRDRLYAINVGSPVKVELVGSMPATRAAEKALHTVLKAHRVRGEWYDQRFALCVLDDLGEIVGEVGSSTWDLVSIESLGEALDAAFLTEAHIMSEAEMLATYDPDEMELVS